MSKLTRVTGKVFGETASPTGDENNGPYIGQFGSAKTAEYTGTGDVATIQAKSSAWANGWIDAVTPNNQYPSLPERTGVDKVLSYQECYLLQRGVAEWDEATDYYLNCFCSHEGVIYKSLIDNNINIVPGTDGDSWEVYQFQPIGEWANKDLNNLTDLGNARLQYAPFSINKGAKNAVGENVTLHTNSEIIYKKTNYIEIGSPTIEDYTTIRGFSTTNRVTTTNTYSFKTLTSLTFQVEFTTSNDVSTHQAVTGGTSLTNGYDPINIDVRSGNLTIGFNDDRSGKISTTANANTTYIVKIIYENGLWSAYVDNSLIGTKEYNISNLSATNEYINFGTRYDRGAFNSPFQGAINMKNTYFIADGNTWNPVIDGTSSDYDWTESAGTMLLCEPCTITTCDGRIAEFDTQVGLDISAYEEGSYKVFKDFASGDLLAIAGDIKEQRATTSGMWLDISTCPANFKIDGVTNNDLVYIGSCDISSSHIITAVRNNYLNNNFIIELPNIHIEETYKNGDSWYRIWSADNTGYRWCEQGGNVITNKATSVFTVDFLKTFTDTSYNFIQSQYSSSGDYVQYITDKTTSSIKVTGQNNSTNFNWRAEGYIA